MSTIDSFPAFQKDLQNYLQNYLDNHQKENFFKLNVNVLIIQMQRLFYSNMLVCFDNIRQINEKIEECVKKEEKKKEKFTMDMRNVYFSNLVRIFLLPFDRKFWRNVVKNVNRRKI